MNSEYRAPKVNPFADDFDISDAAVLRRAGELERLAPDDSWTWYQVRAYPAALIRLVTQGEIVITGRRHGDLLYRRSRQEELA